MESEAEFHGTFPGCENGYHTTDGETNQEVIIVRKPVTFMTQPAHFLGKNFSGVVVAPCAISRVGA